MKKIIIVACLGLCISICNAQHTSDSLVANDVQTATNLKSGNVQDIFSNFFRLAVSNLTGSIKSLSFSSTILAMRAKANPAVMVDTNYRVHTFDRNFQFNLSIKLNHDYSFKGFSGGFTWAIVNKRDSTMLTLGGKWDKIYRQSFYRFSKNKSQYRQSLQKKNRQLFDTPEDSLEWTKAKNYFDRADYKGENYSMDSLPASFKAYCNNNGMLDTAFRKYAEVQNAYNAALQNARVKPLLTLTLNGMVDSAGSFNGSNATLAYLQGVRKKGNGIELDFRISSTLKDTLTDSAMNYHGILTATGGADWTFITDHKTGDPIAEIKPYVEYDNIYLNLLPGETQIKFMLNAQLRFRVINSLWIPITIKYDTKSHNVFGFLNVSLNLGALKSFKK